jgi:hypothetical protein
MQDSNYSEFQKTSEHLRGAVEERQRQEQEDLGRQQYLAPAAPSNIPLATFGQNNEDDEIEEDKMAMASSLRERLKQYQSLKAEQEMNSALITLPTDPDSFMGPPIEKLEETKEEGTMDDTPPGMCTKIPCVRLIDFLMAFS